MDLRDGVSDEPDALRFEAVFDDSATCGAGEDNGHFGAAGTGVMCCTTGTVLREPPSDLWGNRLSTPANGSGPENI